MPWKDMRKDSGREQLEISWRRVPRITGSPATEGLALNRDLSLHMNFIYHLQKTWKFTRLAADVINDTSIKNTGFLPN